MQRLDQRPHPELEWYTCNVCVGESDPQAESLWNEKGERMGLEVYVGLCNEFKPPQQILTIKTCPDHQNVDYVRPQIRDRQEEEVRVTLRELEKEKGGIGDVDTRL